MSEIANFRFNLRHGNLSELIANPDSVNLYEPIIAYNDTDSYGAYYFGFKVENSNYKYWADVINEKIEYEGSDYSKWQFDENNKNYILVDHEVQSKTVTEKIYIYAFLSRSMEDSTNSSYTQEEIWNS